MKTSVDWIALGICATGLVLYIIILVVFLLRIRKAKRMLPPGAVAPKASKSFKGVFAAAVALIVLPVLVPMETYLIAIVCATGVLGEFLALRDRLSQLKSPY